MIGECTAQQLRSSSRRRFRVPARGTSSSEDDCLRQVPVLALAGALTSRRPNASLEHDALLYGDDCDFRALGFDPTPI